jgi:hypothetical protein
VRCKQLFLPKVIDPDNNNIRPWDDYEKSKFHLNQPVNLGKENWAIAYG